MKIFSFLQLIIALQCSAQQTPPYIIASNIAVKDSTGKTNYEVFSMNMDGSNKIILPTTLMWHGRTMLLKTGFIL